MTRLEQQIAFIMEIDKVKDIFRQNYLAAGNRRENDAEHSWHIALMAILLKEYTKDEIDISRVMTMLLIHDLVEIDAGDTYAYDAEGALSKRDRELEAADRIFGILPQDQKEYFRGLWDEFEEYETSDAKYAHLLDRLQPLLLNAASGGISWAEHGVKKSQIKKRNERAGEVSVEIAEYINNLIEENVLAGKLINE